jgi:hypothetical protein
MPTSQCGGSLLLETVMPAMLIAVARWHSKQWLHEPPGSVRVFVGAESSSASWQGMAMSDSADAIDDFAKALIGMVAATKPATGIQAMSQLNRIFRNVRTNIGAS